MSEIILVAGALSAKFFEEDGTAQYRLIEWEGDVFFGGDGTKTINAGMGRGMLISSVWAHTPQEALQHFQDIYPDCWMNSSAG